MGMKALLYVLGGALGATVLVWGLLFVAAMAVEVLDLGLFDSSQGTDRFFHSVPVVWAGVAFVGAAFGWLQVSRSRCTASGWRLIQSRGFFRPRLGIGVDITIRCASRRTH